MSTHLIQINGGRRVETRKEHAERIALAAVESCADEGGRMRQASASCDAPDLYAPIHRLGRSRVFREDDKAELWKFGWHLALRALGGFLLVLLVCASLWKVISGAPA